MKKILIGLGIAGAVAFASLAALPTFVTLNGAAGNAAGAQVIFPADPNSQVRLVSCWYQSDTATNLLSFITGTGAYVVGTNSPAGTSINVLQTNGLTTGASVIIQSANGRWITNCTISSFPQSTNITLSLTPAFGFTNGDSLYLMGSASTIPTLSTTNALNGEAIYVGNYGRPVLVTMSPASVSNRLNAVSAHYDSQSQ
jgi:hypothetical protein